MTRIHNCIVGLAFVVVALHTQTARALEGGRIPVLAWNGPPANQTTVERYRELAAAGFTHSYTYFPSETAQAAALDVANAAGVKLLLQFQGMKAHPAEMASKFKNHPGTGGYFLTDEAEVRQFPELADLARKIQSVDNLHPIYINLFPNYAEPAQYGARSYEEYLDRFLKEIPANFISFDHYPNLGHGKLRPGWYANLDRALHIARTRGTPFWGFVLSVAHLNYPTPSLKQMRLEAFSNLAYGAQGIQYFTYWAPKAPNEPANYHDSPINYSGSRTPTYQYAKAINDEIRVFSPIFYGAKVLEVMHAGPSTPEGTATFKPISLVRSLKTNGHGAIVSLLAQQDRYFVVVVNREPLDTTRIEIEFDQPNRVDSFGKDGLQKQIAAAKVIDTLDAGDVRVFSWKR
jgi:hypothetical protein